MAQVYSFVDDNGVTRLLAEIHPDPQPTSGSLVPVANATGVTVDTTTYDDTIKGSGKLTTLVFPADQGAVAIALSGDAFPRWIMAADGGDGLYIGNGTRDPVNDGNALAAAVDGGVLRLVAGDGLVSTARTPQQVPALGQVSTYLSVTSGPLTTKDFTGQSGVGQQIVPTRDVDVYVQTTTAGVVVADLSPDNMSYTTIYTKTTLATDVCHARVPAGWYLKLTATTAVLGVGTYA